jgi:hypothetical protein
MKTLLPVMPAKAGIHDFTIHETASIAFPKWRQHSHCETRSDEAIQNHALQKPEAHPVRQHRPNAAASVTDRPGSGLRRRYSPRNDGALENARGSRREWWVTRLRR